MSRDSFGTERRVVGERIDVRKNENSTNSTKKKDHVEFILPCVALRCAALRTADNRLVCNIFLRC